MSEFEEKLNKIVWRRPVPKKRRKKILSKKIWLAGGIFLVVSAMTGALFLSPVLKVKKISVSINAASVDETMESFIRSYVYAGFPATAGNILFFDGEKMAEKIKADFPKIDKAEIKKDFLKRIISVKLVEKKSVGIWCVDPHTQILSVGADPAPCFYLEGGGGIFEEAPQSEGSLILLIKTRGISEVPKFGEKVIEGNFLDFILKIKEGLFSVAGINAKEFLLKTGSFDAETATTEGFKIFFDGKKNPGEQIANLKILLEEKIKEERAELEYIDLREGDRIYYKLKGEE